MAMERDGLLKSLFFGDSTVGKIVFRLKDLRIVAANEDAIRSTQFLHSNLDTRRTHRRKDGTEFVAQVGYDRCMFEEQWYFCKYVQDASGAPQSDDSSGDQSRSIPDMILHQHIAKS